MATKKAKTIKDYSGNEIEMILSFRPCTPDKSNDTSLTYELGFLTVNQNGEVRNVSISSSLSEPFSEFRDLAFRSFVSWGFDNFVADPQGLEYRSVYSVDAQRAAVMTKMFKRIERVRENFPVYPASIGQYVQMMCHGLGITRYVEVEGRETGWHTTTEYRFSSLDNLAHTIDMSIAEVKKTKFDSKAAGWTSVETTVEVA